MTKLYETTDTQGLKIIVCPKGDKFSVLTAVPGGFYCTLIKKTLRGAISAANRLAA